MKQVIEGRTYNTETALEIHNAYSWQNDFGDFDETLYKTRKGRFFLAGEGGPMTRWAAKTGGMLTYGKGIQALSEEDALHWCERHGVDADVIEEHFDIEEA